MAKFLFQAPDVIRVKNGKIIAPIEYIKEWAEELGVDKDTPVCITTAEDLQKLIDKAERATLRCHFCTKSQKEVFALIQGFDCFICNECVETCRDIVNEKRVELSKPETAQESEAEKGG